VVFRSGADLPGGDIDRFLGVGFIGKEEVRPQPEIENRCQFIREAVPGQEKNDNHFQNYSARNKPLIQGAPMTQLWKTWRMWSGGEKKEAF